MKQRIEQRTLGAEQLRELVRDNIVIALVDRRKLYDPVAPPPGPVAASGRSSSLVARTADFIGRCVWGPPLEAGRGFVGHYVILEGHDACEYLVADPAREGGGVRVPGADVEAARTSLGTDEDLIIIPWDQKRAALSE